MVYTGRKVSVGIAKEGTRGTASAPTLYYAHVDFQPQDKVDYKDNEGVIWTLAKTHKKEIVQQYSEIPLKGILWSESVGYFMLALLWSVTSAETAVGSGAYQHDFTMLNNNIHPTFTITEKNGVEGLAYALGAIDKLNLTFQQGDYINLESNWKAKLSQTMALTPSYSEETEFTARQIDIFFANDIAGLAGATAICAEGWNLELIKEIEQIFCLWSLDPKDVITKVIDAQVSLTIRHNSDVYTQYMKNGTTKAMRIRITDTNKVIWTNGDNPTIEIDLPKVSFDDVVKEGGRDDIIKQNLTISGLFDVTTSSLVTWKVINSTNVY